MKKNFKCLCDFQKEFFPKSKVMILNPKEVIIIEALREKGRYNEGYGGGYYGDKRK